MGSLSARALQNNRKRPLTPRPSLRQRWGVLGLMFQRVARSFSFIIIFCMVRSPVKVHHHRSGKLGPHAHDGLAFSLP